MIRLRPKEWSIRLHLFAFAATILVPLILLGSYFATEFAERERERYQEVAKALAADIAADVDRELDSTIAALQALSTSPALRNGDLEAFDRQARETLHYRGSAIAVRDQTGQQIINTYAPWGTPLPVSTHPVLRKTDQTALETQRPVVSDLYQGAVAKALYVLVDVPVTIRGEARYVLNIALTPERIRRILASSNLPPDWIVAVVDGSNRIIARSRDHERLLGVDTQRSSPAPAEAGAALWQGLNAEGVPVLAASERSRLSAWRVTASVPLAVLGAPLTRSLLAVAGLGGLGLALSLALALLYGRGLARGMLDLSLSAEALGRGEQIPATATSVREVNQISRAMARASADLHERALAQETAARRQELLIHELNHRVKNTLATVQSLAWQVVRPGVPPRIAQERFQERLLALSRTHNLLNETLWEGASLRTILEAEFQPFMAETPRIRLSGPDVYLPATHTVVLGMALHELTTNAAKYGALSAATGRVQVDWRVEGHGRGATLILDWCEMGGPPVQAQPRPGFGSRLLRQTITQELGGELSMRFEPEGACCQIVVGIAPAEQRAA
ncbi:sensor histidine kinase [Microvirga aerilata]|uniref:histidine kinase n=1 Tax=Microvirga aerilata TaxID=670292 RepID=A0A937D177_9HYPH|nr:sensor histidine kinase [Microvirga aerilata]MBL0406681.1 sensor histidine kinase [Microvirga aerilata]